MMCLTLWQYLGTKSSSCRIIISLSFCVFLSVLMCLCSEMICCNFELGCRCKIRLYLKKCFVLKIFGELEDIDVIDVSVIQKRIMTCSNKVEKKVFVSHVFKGFLLFLFICYC
ncbi:hypothetical protein INR49_024856 [Caranx melampygus]|nr:hypothetical protein INR49_024856 [Caranx melampygus]